MFPVIRHPTSNFFLFLFSLVYINNHTSVWGSFWADGKWGYKCCRAFIKNSYCTGSAGIAAAETASAKALLATGSK
jgi:hypothetical protein